MVSRAPTHNAHGRDAYYIRHTINLSLSLSHSFSDTQNLTGAPVQKPAASQRIGNQLRATTLLQDINLLELIQHLTHERIPERLVHARGTGAHGYFEVTDDITDLTSAAFLNRVGKRTPLFTRFSTVAGERASAETVRDTRGFAFKLRTEEGILDWLFLSTPVFPIRDGAKFPSFTHATKRNPKSGLPDHSMFWDYFTHNEEAIHFLMFLFSDRATPVNFQHADCFSINCYKFTKPDGKFVYVRIHVKTNQGVENFTVAEAATVAGEDPDFQTRSLFEDLNAGRTPSWDVYAQVIEPDAVARSPVDIFDATKTLPFKDFPLRKFGRIVLDRNPENNFAEVEQAAFSPTNIVPGWSLSPDPILQTRALAYADTQRYRLGTNFIQFPINRPAYSFTPLNRDGQGASGDNLGATPNYYPSSFFAYGAAAQYATSGVNEERFDGPVVDYESPLRPDDFAQATSFWRDVLAREKGQQDNFVGNVAAHLRSAVAAVRGDVYALFARVDEELGKRIARATEILVAEAAAAEENGAVEGDAAQATRKIAVLHRQKVEIAGGERGVVVQK
ncbi:catalase-domain-containing protein [Cryphonectria parasitica EP155]|uniref:Catalase-domain-containing protein n=1 Tax=Cryphonectria parasitica (strain ATCC 38755 / EP155) TaxID=660469 RepID=A0A9P4YBT6_CRYP1|nr:catalase-domain-containing protein [Cryphonectria parasitica EP155]KAF3770458.1 catalase-domain-containing protein [Cryphonectria parasitica EP155]